MTIWIRCFRIFTNDRGFDDWERAYEHDAEFETYEDAVIHMHEVCGNTSCMQGWVFDVEIEGRGWDE